MNDLETWLKLMEEKTESDNNLVTSKWEWKLNGQTFYGDFCNQRNMQNLVESV